MYTHKLVFFQSRTKITSLLTSLDVAVARHLNARIHRGPSTHRISKDWLHIWIWHSLGPKNSAKHQRGKPATYNSHYYTVETLLTSSLTLNLRYNCWIIWWRRRGFISHSSLPKGVLEHLIIGLPSFPHNRYLARFVEQRMMTDPKSPSLLHVKEWRIKSNQVLTIRVHCS